MDQARSLKAIYFGRSLLLYRIDQFDAPRTVIDNDMDLRARIIHEYHDDPVGGPFWAVKRLSRLSLVISSSPTCISWCATEFVRAKFASECVAISIVAGTLATTADCS